MPQKRFSFRWKISLLALLITLGLVLACAGGLPLLSDIMQSLDHKIADLHFQLKGSRKPAAPVVVAVLDKNSIQEVGPWPWPREDMARLLRKLGESGAAVVGLDMGFFDPITDTALGYLAEEQGRIVHDTRVSEVLDRIKGRLTGGNQLAAALLESPAPMVLGYLLYLDPREAEGVEEHVRNRRRTIPLGSSIKLLDIPPGMHESQAPLPEAYLVEPNLDELNQAAELMGFFNLIPDRDGIVRTAPMVIRHARPSNGQQPAGYDYFPSLALNMLRAYLGRDLWAKGVDLKKARASLTQVRGRSLYEVQMEMREDSIMQQEAELHAAWNRIAPSLVFGPEGVRAIRMGNLDLDTTPSGGMRLNLCGPAGTFEHVSWADILKDRLDPSALKGKMVVVGGPATGHGGNYATSLDPAMPGVELQATALDNLVSGQWLRHPDWAGEAEVITMVIVGVLCALVLLLAPAGWNLWLMVLLGVLLVGFNHFIAFSLNDWVLPIAYPLFSLLIIFVAAGLSRYFLEDKQELRTRRTFSRYVSDQVIDQVAADPEALKLGGQRRELSIMFTGLQGFNAISEVLEPEDLTRLLNQYHNEMGAIILEEAGTVDKYEGDSIVAFWNAPLDQPDHAERAVRTALRCQERMAELQPQFERICGELMHMRIGIHTGRAVVGDLGSQRRFDYTVMGDAASLAWQLQAANKLLGSGVMVSQSTWQNVEGLFDGRELGSLLLTGHKDPFTVYQPLGVQAPAVADPNRQAFALGLKLIQEGNPFAAIKLFERIAGDPVATAYYHKLLELAKAGEGWRGVWKAGGE